MLIDALFERARRTPQDVGVIDEQGEHTYGELAAAAGGLAIYLQAQTTKPHVGVLLPAGAGFVASFYATLLAGKSVVPINFLLGDTEVGHVLADSGVDTVLTVGPLAGRLKDKALNVVDLGQLPRTPAGLAPHIPAAASGDMAVLMYTSGTSGLPKGVVLTYGNLQSDVDAAIAHARLQHQHRFLGVIPLFHAFGMTGAMLAPIQLGAQAIYMTRFSAVGFMEKLRKHQASLVFGVPSMFAAILHLKNAGPEDFKSIYAMISGAEPLPTSLREAFEKRFGVPLYEGYGLTETSPVATLNVPGDSRPGTVGRAVPGAQIRITDEEGRAVAAGGTGEICIKGPMVMKEYYRLPQETGAALGADGYFRTGDLGFVDADGFLSINGRKKDLIIVAGEKASREIEDALLKHAGVAEAAVVGRKDATRGEVVVAFVIAAEGQTPTAEELRDFCRSSGLAAFKVPREIIFVREFSRSPTGKVLKRALAQTLTPGAAISAGDKAP